jgi:cell wall-associated NlpC family hydrolase
MKLVKVAKAQIGDRYSAGRSGPNAFDCSGLTRYVFKQVTGKNLPHHSRSQFGVVKKIRTKDAQPGDLVFFFKRGAHHVGIYIGGGKMVDAAGYGKGVRVSPISGSWWGRTFSGIGRVLPAV